LTREQLEHAIRAACDIASDPEVIVFGSQSILGQYPDAPAALCMSAEVDIVPKNFPQRVEAIDGALGELSTFHHEFGFYVHGVPLANATLPDGWEGRTVSVSNSNTAGATGLCVEAHDLAASKLAAFRDKDRDFVRVLLIEKMVKPRKLVQRIEQLPIEQAVISQLVGWVHGTVQEFASDR
jgi:uncharacterized nucleotidyltransferase DUF6036